MLKPAAEAKVSSQNVRFGKAQAILSDIERRIERAIELGHFSISIPRYLSVSGPEGQVIKQLRDKGYKVEPYSDQRESSSSTTIGWS